MVVGGGDVIVPPFGVRDEGGCYRGDRGIYW